MKYLFAIILGFYVSSSFALRPSTVVFFSAQANTAGQKNSAVIDASQVMSGSLQASFSDVAAAGTLVLQCSNDSPEGLTHSSNGMPIPTNWSTCANGSTTGSVAVSGGALSFLSLQWLNSRWLRVIWTRSAGAGTLTVTGQLQAM